MPAPCPSRRNSNTPALLEAFFERSQDGFFFMMIDQPIEWGPGVDKDAVLDYVFAHQRMTKVNPAMAAQFRAAPAELIGMTPSDFFRHDLAAGRRGWRRLFDAGHTHSITNERRLDGSAMWVEGDYMCFYDAAGRITGHFGIQRDVTDRTLAAEELEQSRAELRALAARLQTTREEERTRIAREIHDELGQALTALKLDLAWLESQLPRTNSGAFRVDEASITARIDETMEIVRRIASELRPSVLDQLGLEAAIEWLVQEAAKRTGIEVTLAGRGVSRAPRRGGEPRVPDHPGGADQRHPTFQGHAGGRDGAPRGGDHHPRGRGQRGRVRARIAERAPVAGTGGDAGAGDGLRRDLDGAGQTGRGHRDHRHDSVGRWRQP